MSVRLSSLFANGAAHEAPVIEAEAMTAPLPGPALIVRGDTQIAVAPGWRADSGSGRPDPS